MAQQSGIETEEILKGNEMKSQEQGDTNEIQTCNIEDLQKELEKAQTKIKITEEENIKLKTMLQETSAVSDETWAKYEVLKAENDQLRQEICGYKEINQSKTESLMALCEKIREKNEDLAELTEELQTLSDTCEDQDNTIEELETKLYFAKIERSNEDSIKLETILQENQSEADQPLEENKSLEVQMKPPKRARLRKLFKALCCCFSSLE